MHARDRRSTWYLAALPTEEKGCTQDRHLAMLAPGKARPLWPQRSAPSYTASHSTATDKLGGSKTSKVCLPHVAFPHCISGTHPV
jgi:hypothetical protein